MTHIRRRSRRHPLFLVLFVSATYSDLAWVSASSSPPGGEGAASAATADLPSSSPSKALSVLGRAASAARSARTSLLPPSSKDDDEDGDAAERNTEAKPVELRPRVVSLNVMVAGLSGLGKTTTCNHMLELWNGSGGGAGPKTKMTRHVDPSRRFERYDAENNTSLRVRIIDTPGFGNRVNHRDAVRPIVRYISKCRRKQFRHETSAALHMDVSARHTDDVAACDDLVHVCLYFLSPGRFLQIDKHFLRQIQREICIVPVIAKSDTMTDGELARYRSDIMLQLKKEGIVPYDFDSAGEAGPHHRGRRSGEPLAIVSRGGTYPWGKVGATDPAHSDLLLVRDMLLSKHTEKFVLMAKEKYGVYRKHRIRNGAWREAAKYAAFVGLLVNLLVPVWAAATAKDLVGTIGTLSSRALGALVPVGGRRKGRAAEPATVLVPEVEPHDPAPEAGVSSPETPPEGQASSRRRLSPFPLRWRGTEKSATEDTIGSQTEDTIGSQAEVVQQAPQLPPSEPPTSKKDSPGWFLWLRGE